MTEILIDVDFGHPSERVWRALTDRAVLSQWFMRTDLEPYEGRRFYLMPDGLLGLAGPLEGELVEVAAPRRLVMLWRGEQMHSRVTWELVPLPEGCRLRMSHTGFIGVKGSLRRKELQRTYDRMLHDRLPRVLDQLATGRADLGEPAPQPPPPILAGPPLANGPDLRPGPEPELADGSEDGAALRRVGPLGWLGRLFHRRRGQLLAAAGAALLAVLTATLISGLSIPSLVPPLGAPPDDRPITSPGASEPSLGVVPPPGPASSGATAAPTGGVTSSPSPVDSPRPGPPSASAGPAPAPKPTDPAPGQPRFRGSYRTVGSSGSGFTGEIAVTNTGSTAVGGWAVVVTLRAGAVLGRVRGGVDAAINGNSVTFTPKGGKVGAGGTRTFEFDVSGGGTAPTACRVEGVTCAGV